MNEYGTFNDAIQNIEHFIEEVYNSKRLHSSIGYKSPVELETLTKKLMEVLMKLTKLNQPIPAVIFVFKSEKEDYKYSD